MPDPLEMKINLVINKYKLNQKTWTHKGFHGILHFFFAVGEQALKPLKAYYGDSHRITVFYFSNNYGDWYWNNEDMIRLRQSFIRQVNKDPQVLSKLLTDWHWRVKLFNQTIKQIDQTDLSKFSNFRLLKLYQEWYAAYLREYGIAIGIQDAFSMHADDFVLPYFKKIINQRGDSQHFNDYYLLLTSAVTETFITREYRDRLKILKIIKSGQKINSVEVVRALNRHVKIYYWLNNNYAKDFNLGVDYFTDKLKEIVKINPDQEILALNQKLKQIKQTKKKLINKLKLDREAKNLLKIIEVFAYMQDERKKYVLIATHYQNIFMEEFGRRLNIPRPEMEYTFIHELGGLLKKKKIDLKIFRERRQAVLVIHTLKGYEVIGGEPAKKIYQKIFHQSVKKTDEIKGTVASSGKATGRVKIVFKIHDLVNLQVGDVLVASMTRPEMTAAMKKAAAIVTDEGGITCHAAVISRELHKPCIINTKIATAVLKDGDMVEVDADNNIIKKIN